MNPYHRPSLEQLGGKTARMIALGTLMRAVLYDAIPYCLRAAVYAAGVIPKLKVNMRGRLMRMLSGQISVVLYTVHSGLPYHNTHLNTRAVDTIGRKSRWKNRSGHAHACVVPRCTVSEVSCCDTCRYSVRNWVFCGFDFGGVCELQAHILRTPPRSRPRY